MLKKFCSTLVLFFVKFPSRWEPCLRHVVCCLRYGEVVPLDSLDQLDSTRVMLPYLDRRRMTVVLWFSSTLVDEISKIDSSNMKR